jgi:hypothetical protein
MEKEKLNFIDYLIKRSDKGTASLVDTLLYFSKRKTLPKNISFDFINLSFKKILENELIDVDKFYMSWLIFLLKFSKNPFKENVTIKNKNLSLKFKNFTKENWNENIEDKDLLFKTFISKKEKSTDLEVLKFLYNKNYNPVIDRNDINEECSNTIFALHKLFKKFYNEGNKKEALDTISMFPKTWPTYWNLHLLDKKENRYISKLIEIFSSQKNLVKNQEILTLELRLKKLLNEMETTFDEEKNLDRNVVEEIYTELAREVKTNINDDILVHLFTKKLFKKVIFKNVKEIYKSVPKKVETNEKTAIFIDIKKILEECVEQNIEEAKEILKDVNKFLFKELRDVKSGVSFISQMIKNSTHKGLPEYIYDLSLLLNEKSIEANTLFENLVDLFSSKKLSALDFSAYIKTLDRINLPQFKILTNFAKVFSGNFKTTNLSQSVIENYEIFINNTDSLYIMLEPIYTGKISTQNIQKLTADLLSEDFPRSIAKTFGILLTDFFYEQPYMDLAKSFPKEKLNKNLVLKIRKTIDDFVHTSIDDKDLEIDFEEKSYAVEECIKFLDRIIKYKHEEVRIQI